jgi:CRISPR-associated protein Cmr4
MYKSTLPFFIYCETPVHVGSGSELGYIDLPIQREKHSGFPKIEASGLKGCLRDVCSDDDDFKTNVEVFFGPKDGNEHAGSLGFLDGRILLFPVKSVKGVFAWITCPYVLSKFKEEIQLFFNKQTEGLKNIEAEKIMPYSVPQGTNIIVSSPNNYNDKTIILEEYGFQIEEEEKNSNLTKIATFLSETIFPTNQEKDIFKNLREKMKRDIVVLSDDDFKDFVEMSTEVITRVRIDEKTHTVSNTALFNEEYVPENTVFYSSALFSKIFVENKQKNYDENSVSEYFKKVIEKHEIIQIGGNSTIGKGLVRIVPLGGN